VRDGLQGVAAAALWVAFDERHFGLILSEPTMACYGVNEPRRNRSGERVGIENRM
jgi:hypothetical protein